MSDYTKSTNFTAKDTLPSGNSGKIVKGTEIDTEFTAIASAITSKANLASPAFSGTPTAPTATAGTNTTQIATTAFVTGSLGTMSSQNANAVAITGGTISGLSPSLPVASGGTGNSSATPNAVFVGGATSTSAILAVKPGTLGNSLISTAGSTVTAGSFVVGVEYSILTLGSTDFTLIGASANTIGIIFTATGVGVGSGTAKITTWASTTLNVYALTNGTTVASTSGTSIDFTSIPSWVKRITVMLNGVSTNGTSILQVQLGTSSGVTTSGYTSYAWTASASYQSSTTGLMFGSNNSASARYSIMTICTMGSNLWVESNTGSESGGGASGGGSVTLSGTLDRIRLTTVNGTDTFDAGSINILYE